MASPRPSSPAITAPRKSSNLRKGTSAVPSPKPSAAASLAPTPTTSRPTSPAPPTPLQSLDTLLHLPLRLTLIPSGALPERTVEGTLWTYDASTSVVVLTSLSHSSSSNPTTAQNPSNQKRSYHLLKTPQIKSVVVLSTSPDPTLPDPASALAAINLKEVDARVKKAVRKDQEERARVGQGVSEEAQALFDALGKTLPVRWAGGSIVVMDEVMISPPYGPADVRGTKSAGGQVERVRKVVSLGCSFAGCAGANGPFAQLEGVRQQRADRQVRST